MGRRSINTTKSGKFMNPTDQARKEARKKELKKNKKQRMFVRQAVLKAKDPRKIIDEMRLIDSQEYDTINPPRLSEKVLKEKRRKLKETLERVVSLYEREAPDQALDIKKLEIEYEKERLELQSYYEQVKNAEKVQLDQIPLPEAPGMIPMPSGPMPRDIPLPETLPHSQRFSVRSILKGQPSIGPLYPVKRLRPPGPPPGPPPSLDDDSDDEPGEYGPERSVQTGSRDVSVVAADDSRLKDKSRKIRFADDAMRDPEAPEKDTRLKFKPALSPLQMKMLELAGHTVPTTAEADKDKTADNSAQHSDSDEDGASDDEKAQGEERKRKRGDGDSDESDSDADNDEEERRRRRRRPGVDDDGPLGGLASRVPPGPPVGMPPGPSPGMPSMMYRMPSMRPPGAPPGPPPAGQPVRLPPGPPPGLPLGMNSSQAPPHMPMPPRGVPPGPPPGMPPPRYLRPPGMPPPSVPPPLMPPGTGPVPSPLAPASAPPAKQLSHARTAEDDQQHTATIEAKPQIKHVRGDVTRFTPTAIKVKRELKDAKGRLIKPIVSHKPEQQITRVHTFAGQTKDEAYDSFMKEMMDFL